VGENVRNLPVKRVDSFWNKIKNWFANKIYKNNVKESKVEETNTSENSYDEQRKAFIDELKTSQPKRVTKEEVRISTEKNPELLDRMSEEQLRALEKYYDELILKEKGGDVLLNIDSKEDMRKLLERKPELLDRFSVKQLELLEEYYDELIRKEKNKLG